jgi:hypothetical protein
MFLVARIAANMRPTEQFVEFYYSTFDTNRATLSTLYVRDTRVHMIQETDTFTTARTLYAHV